MPTELYLITPPRINDLAAFASRLDAAMRAAPVAAVQLRLKEGESIADSSVVVQAAETIYPIVRAHGGLCLLNDSAQLAADTGADGVHLGQGDGDVASARALLGPDAVIGVTCHSSKDLAFDAVKAGADYVAFGAVFPTQTKAAPTVAELELFQWWHEAMTTPSVAIGGITPNNAAQVVAAGADFLAVSAGVWEWPDGPAQAVSSLSLACTQPA